MCKIENKILSEFNEIIINYGLKLDSKEKDIILFNDNFKLLFKNQNLDGIELYYINKSLKIKIDFFLCEYTGNEIYELSHEQKNSENKKLYIIEHLNFILNNCGKFLLEQNQKEIEKYVHWKEKNEEFIYEKLFSKIKWKPNSMKKS
jgi:hypothetical protein